MGDLIEVSAPKRQRKTIANLHYRNVRSVGARFISINCSKYLA